MELILMFVAGMIVLIMAVIAIIRGITYRIQTPNDDLKKEILELKKRINDIEHKQSKD